MLGAAGDTTGISPVQVDHLVRAYTGWLGMQGANIVDAMASPFSDRVKPAGKIDDYLGGFVKTLPTGGSRYLEEFYKQTQAIHEVVNDIKLAREVGDLEKARDLETSEAWKVQSAKLYSQAERQIGKINKQIKHIRNSTEMDPQDKRDRIEALTAQKNQLARVVTLRTLQSKKEE